MRDRASVNVLMGPFAVRVHARLESFLRPFQIMYGAFPLLKTDSFADFHVVMERPRNLRGWIQPQVLFKLDGRSLFEPFPVDTAFPLFEWGLNWCVGQRSHQYLILHAAVVERNNRAILLPALPGSGKSTLCAALINRGWRLMSDEFGLFDFNRHCLMPFPRPISLKNESIEVIRRFAPEAVLGPLFPKTRKGTVAHLRSPDASVQRMHETAPPAWVIFPKFSAGARLSLRTIPQSQAFLRLAHNSFNYSITGADGFQAVGEIIRSSACYDLAYGDLDEAVYRIDTLTL
jgi:HprK-related kinase A